MSWHAVAVRFVRELEHPMKRRRSRRDITLSLCLLGIAACGGIGVRPHLGDSDAPSSGVPGRAGPTPPRDGSFGSPDRGHRPLAQTERRVCKATGWPRGWVATMYERAGGECPAGRGADSTGMMAVITRHELLPRESILDICADQIIPAGWLLISREPQEAGEFCPGAEKSGASSVKRIRRVH
jgi:hypothetical protein